MRSVVALCVFSLALLSFGLCGCSGGGNEVRSGHGGGCTASIDPALVVYINDAVTGLPAAANATITVTDGSYTTTVTNGNYADTDLRPLYDPSADSNEALAGFYGPYERAGTYTIRITRPGYETAERTGIRVTAGECHVSTRILTIALTPAN